MTTHVRKAVTAVDALEESSSWKDASWTVNMADKATISES